MVHRQPLNPVPLWLRRSSWALGLLLPTWAYAALPPIPAPAASAHEAVAQALPIYPRVRINGRLQEKLVRFYLIQNQIYTERAALGDLGIRLQDPDCLGTTAPDVLAQLPAGYFSLTQCGFLQSHYAPATQLLDIQAPLDRLDLPTTLLGNRASDAAPVLSRPDFSTVLNYDSNITGGTGGSRSLGLYTQWRWGTPWGYFETNHVQTNTAGNTTHQRLDSYWRSTWPTKGLSLTVGDTTTSQLSNSSGSRIAGIQLSSSYSIQPWYQTLPQNLLRGSVQLPSTIDLYLDGVKRYSQTIAAGPYELALPPSISQTGQAQILTRDVLGRQTVIDIPLYDGTGLLAAGLQEWSVEAGYLRDASGSGSGSVYDRDLLFSGTWRKGIHDRLTLQLHGEAKNQYQQTGVALYAAAKLPQQIGLQLSSSRYRGVSGQQWGLFALQKGTNWSIAAGLNKNTAHFTSLGGTLNGRIGTPPSVAASNERRQAYVQAGWGLRNWGNLSLGRIRSEQSSQIQDIWNLNWSKTLTPSASLSASMNYDLRNPKERSAMISLSMQLGSNLTANATIERPDNGAAFSSQIQRNAQGVGSWGWSLGMQGDSSHQQRNMQASVQYLGAYGDWNAQYYRANQGLQSWQSNWRGGLVLLGGKLAATRPVSDSFALISTNGVPDIPIRAQNNFVGRSDSQGYLFVPNLSAYQSNRISIDTARLPADRRIANSSGTIVPYEKSGARLLFNVQRVHASTASLTTPTGQAIPAGSSVLDASGRVLSVVGFDGRVYLDNDATSAGTLHIRSQSATGQTQRCHFTFSLTPPDKQKSFVHDYGEVICQPD